MYDFNIVEGLPPYEFADRAVWSDDRLRIAAGGLFKFLRTHVPKQSAPEEVLFDADQALQNIAFEMKMRHDEETGARRD